MKKLWLGALLLGVLLTIGLYNACKMDKHYKEISRLLKNAADMTLAGDLSQGMANADAAQALWEKQRDAVATVADHQPLENVECLLAQLETFAQAEGAVEFAACCRAAAQQVEAVGAAQTLNWQNLL